MTIDGTHRVLLVYPIAPELRARIEASGAEVVLPRDASPEAIEEAVADVDAMLTRGPAHITRRHIEHATRLKVIAQTGSGTDAIDVEAASERGIPVTSGAGLGQRAVSEWTIGAAIALHRGLLAAHMATVAGTVEWHSRLNSFTSHEFTGSTMGIVGFGHIGRDVARLAQAFDVKVLVHDPYASSFDGVGIVKVERCDRLHDLLERSATVSLHIPLNATTRGFIGAAELRAIGPESVLVNVSRGGIVDEPALVNALANNELGGAAIDVLEGEPPRQEQIDALAPFPNVILSPHVAGATTNSIFRMTSNAVDVILDVLAGRPPSGVVNARALALD